MSSKAEIVGVLHCRAARAASSPPSQGLGVVDIVEVLARQRRDGEPFPGLNRQEALGLQLEHALAGRGRTDAEVVSDTFWPDEVSGGELARNDEFAAVVGRDVAESEQVALRTLVGRGSRGHLRTVSVEPAVGLLESLQRPRSAGTMIGAPAAQRKWLSRRGTIWLSGIGVPLARGRRRRGLGMRTGWSHQVMTVRNAARRRSCAPAVRRPVRRSRRACADRDGCVKETIDRHRHIAKKSPSRRRRDCRRGTPLSPCRFR